ncbi:helix-turn-helix domain-containing protein [Endozoicomonas sp. Mp262]|uniref:zinc ribbon domain-containing protein n=1 Tax=Endozoicomonas sp. Mp262 TaxID=2919499 RepID=UPI0021E03936
MKILKAYKFRLEATPEQHVRLMQLCGTARFVWNRALSICNEKWESGEKIPSSYTMAKWLPIWKKDDETSFLAQGWYEFRRQLEYKQAWAGGEVVAVNPAYTSQACSACGHTDKANRKTQAKFI